MPGLERWTQKLVFYCQCSQEKSSNGKTMWWSETKIYRFWSEKCLPDVCAFQVISWCKSGFKILFGADSDKPTNQSSKKVTLKNFPENCFSFVLRKAKRPTYLRHKAKQMVVQNYLGKIRGKIQFSKVIGRLLRGNVIWSDVAWSVDY